MSRSKIARIMMASVVVMLTCTYCTMAGEKPIRIRELSGLEGQQVTVKGRTGVRVEDEETPSQKVYTVRDDYGDQVYVRTKQDYPVMGVTYLVTGTAGKDSKGNKLYIEEQSRTKAYPSVPMWLVPLIVLVVAGGAGSVIAYVRRRGTTATLAPAWGLAAVQAGPDQGKNFALRGDRVVVGRGQDPTSAVSFELDTNISRNHGVISRQGQTVYYEDSGSRNGSWIGTQQMTANQRVPITPGSLVRLGTSTVIRIDQTGPQAGQQTVVGGDGNRGEDSTHRAQQG